MQGAGDGRWLPSIFQGYNFVTLLVVANLAFSGLLVSWVMKFADSILKVPSLPPCTLAACWNTFDAVMLGVSTSLVGVGTEKVR